MVFFSKILFYPDSEYISSNSEFFFSRDSVKNNLWQLDLCQWIQCLPPANEVWWEGNVFSISVCPQGRGGVPVVQNFATRCPNDPEGGTFQFEIQCQFRCHFWWGGGSIGLEFWASGFLGGGSRCNTTEVPPSPRKILNFFFSKRRGRRRTVLFSE